MPDSLSLMLPLFGGVILGIGFFYSLWLTVEKGLQSPHPELWFIIGFIVRMVLTLAGFYVISDHQFWPLIACLIGFLMGRIAINRYLSIYQKQHSVES